MANDSFIHKMGKLWLSPMEGASDLGFRSICVEAGACLTFTEMIRGAAFVRGNKATLDLVDTFHASVPTGIQLFVTKVDELRAALKKIKEGMDAKDGRFSNLCCIDLNFGCPSQDVIRMGGAPAMLKRTTRMRELLTVLKQESPLPCGIKMRLGLNDREKEQKVYLRVVEIANEVGLDFLTVHAKTANQSSRDPIDFDCLQEVLDHATVPVIGNGGVVDGPTAKRMLDMGCAGVMIARAAVGNPWVFSEVGQYLETGEEKKIIPTKEMYTQAWKQYEKIAKEYTTKEKYYQYHKKMFSLRMQGDTGYHSPSRVLG